MAPASPLGKAQPGTSRGYGRCLQPGGPGLGHRAQRCSVRHICLGCSPGAQTEGLSLCFLQKDLARKQRRSLYRRPHGAATLRSSGQAPARPHGAGAAVPVGSSLGVVSLPCQSGRLRVSNNAVAISSGCVSILPVTAYLSPLALQILFPFILPLMKCRRPAVPPPHLRPSGAAPRTSTLTLSS